MNNYENENTTATINADNTKVDDKVVKKMIAAALVEVDGYLGTANTLMSGLSGMLNRNKSDEDEAISGINVSISDNEAEATLKVIVEAGKNIPTITQNIVENVTANLEKVGGFKTKSVNVEVVDTMTREEYNEKYKKNDDK